MPVQPPRYEVYTVIPRPAGSFQHRIGVAFHNADGSIGVVLNSLPLDGRIYLRPARPAKSTPDPDSSDPSD